MKRLLLALVSLLAATTHAQVAGLTLEPAASGFERPVGIAHAGDSRLFIVEQTGRIRVVDAGVVLPQPLLDIRTKITSNGERGLLGLAFHPRHQENGLFFINYTDLNGDTVIARYSVLQTDRNRADPTSDRVLLTIAKPYQNHNGGQLQFGRDGYLYIGTGDGGSGGDPGNRAQNLGDLLGKMLRIDVDVEPYAIPPSNPFVSGAGARPEIWASGLRNPWRFSFDRASGDLWIADVGQGQWEEISFQPATSIGGENYGWKRMEGTHCFEPQTGCDTRGLTLPLIEYAHSGGRCSVTGGYVYRGSRSPLLGGAYLYADFCSGEIFGAVRDWRGELGTILLLDAPFTVSTFGEDANGEIYVANYTGGAIYRLSDDRPVIRKRAVRH
jgi:hypothetical protein